MIRMAVLLASLMAQEPAGPGELHRHEFRSVHMGTEFRIILYTTDASTATSASQMAFDRVARLDSILSDYNPESEAMRLCDQAGGPPVPVSAELYTVLDRALDLARRSGGAFDPTINPVVRLWRRARRERKLPDPENLARARALVGYQHIELDPKARTARLAKPGMNLDFGGIAKGFAAQEALKVLIAQGIKSALVAAAGDIAVSAAPPGASGWRVAIAPLEKGGAAPVLLLTHAAVSTSGDAEQFVDIDGKRYSHIVDPRTGLGVVDRASVTVVARDGATADGLDTTVYVLGAERGLPLIEANPDAAALVMRKREGRIQVLESARWKTLPKAEDPHPRK